MLRRWTRSKSARWSLHALRWRLSSSIGRARSIPGLWVLSGNIQRHRIIRFDMRVGSSLRLRLRLSFSYFLRFHRVKQARRRRSIQLRSGIRHRSDRLGSGDDDILAEFPYTDLPLQICRSGSMVLRSRGLGRWLTFRGLFRVNITNQHFNPAISFLIALRA